MTNPKEAYKQVLLSQIKKCPQCPWREVKTQTVLPEGDINSPLVIVGRNPGYQEGKHGRPFIGPGGRSLDRFLRNAGISRKKIWITNLAKCQGGAGDPQPSPQVYETCTPWLIAEFCLIQPKLIVVLGNDALRYVTGNEDASALKMEGQIIPIGRTETNVFVLSHPGYWVRQKKHEEVIMTTMAEKLKQEVQRRHND